MAMLEAMLQREAELERELQVEIAREAVRLDRTTQEQAAPVATVAAPTEPTVERSVAATQTAVVQPVTIVKQLVAKVNEPVRTVAAAPTTVPPVTAAAVATPTPTPRVVLAAPVAQLAVRSPPGHTTTMTMPTTTTRTPPRCVVAPRAVRPGPTIAETLLDLRSDRPDDELSAAFVQAVGRGIMADAAHMVATRHLDHLLAEHLSKGKGCGL